MAAEQPKKPMTAFFLYTDEQRPIIVKQLGDGAKVKGVVVKTAAGQWKDLSAEKKAPYEEKAAAAKAEYDAALESFKQMGGELVRKRKVDKADAKPKKDKDAPKKPAGGGYGQFMAENREKIVKSLPAGSNVISDTAKAASAQWKALSEDEKKPYDEKFKQKMEEYHAAMKEYKGNVAEEEKEEEPSPPPKKAKADRAEKTTTPPKPVKSGKGKGKGCAKAAEAKVEVDATALVEATKLGYEAALRNLAGRADVKDLKKSDNDLLGALKTSGGLVNPARHALLGA